MRFNVETLQEKPISDIQTIFATIPKTSNSIYLSGHFQLGLLTQSHVAQALAYLPKHISQVVFNVEYYYERYNYRAGHVRPGSRRWDALRKDYVEEVYYTHHAGCTKSIGNSLRDCLASLPHSIESVRFQFMEGRFNFSAIEQIKSDVFPSFTAALKYTPTTVHSLSLGNLGTEGSMAEVSALLSACPHSLQYIDVGSLSLGELDYQDSRFDYSQWSHVEAPYSVLSELSPNLQGLDLSHTKLGALKKRDIDFFFSSLPTSLQYLNLGHNELVNMRPIKLGLFLAKVPSNIKQLKLNGNALSRLPTQILTTVFAQVPKTINDLDIGENDLLMLEEKAFEILLHQLPDSITTLRVCEPNRGGLSNEELGRRLARLPAHIKVISFSNSNLMGLSAVDFINLLSYLPPTVEGLDLSAIRLRLEDFSYLIANLPPQFRHLKLNNNNLSCLDVQTLGKVFKRLSPSVRELEISGNGFERLYRSEIETLVSFIPPTLKTLITGGNELTLRNDGAFVPFKGVVQEPFGSEKRFIHQSEFAEYRVVLMQFMQQMGHLSPELQAIIFSYVFPTVRPEELLPLMTKFSTLIISSKPPHKITPKHEAECLSAIDERIDQRKQDNSCLDLSRCGLNRLVTGPSQNKFRTALKGLPENVNTLRLRGNGFLEKGQSRGVFLKLMPRIPANIHCLDLSDNGFDRQDTQTLTQLFASLPPHIETVILNHETALSPAMQIAKRVWPESYWALTAHIPGKLGKTFVLLDDYTKGNSAFWRFCYGHWNRGYTQEAGRLAHAIEHGLIEEDGLQEEIERLSPKNPIGALARRFCFLTYHKPRPQAVLMEDNHDEDAVELQSMNCC